MAAVTFTEYRDQYEINALDTFRDFSPEGLKNSEFEWLKNHAGKLSKNDFLYQFIRNDYIEDIQWQKNAINGTN